MANINYIIILLLNPMNMTETKPLVNQLLTMKKYPGKGGWTYVEVSEIEQDKRTRFGSVRVKGTIDGYELKQYHLMPMGNGNLFLPIKAAIRKITGKKEGDSIWITLYHDLSPIEIPEELITCLREEPSALKAFESLKDGDKKVYIDWIYSAKREETKINRIATAINKLQHGLKLYDKF
jgi:hypothetical protein